MDLALKLTARLIALTQPTIKTRIPTAEALVAYMARVSSPNNQDSHWTAEGLLKYCIKNKHWSIFDMVDAVVEIEAPRDISRQLLRHRSFTFQEFSQRYSDQIEFTEREVRMQDTKNRQNSIDDANDDVKDGWNYAVELAKFIVKNSYQNFIDLGVAKECARVLLPEGLTMSRLYMKGSLRSWIHYLEVREGNGTQKEHTILAGKIREAITPAFPITLGLVDKDESID